MTLEEFTPDTTGQAQDKQLEGKARELADMVGNIVLDDDLPMEIIEMTANTLLEDYRKLQRAAAEVTEENRATRKLLTGF